MTKVLVVAPHPDDETLGCGGTLLRHKADGDYVCWLIVTRLTEELGYSPEVIEKRGQEIETVASMYDFNEVRQLGFPTTTLDAVPQREIVHAISQVVAAIEPDTIYTVFPGDVHTDHRVVFDAVAACSKWFRYPSVREILAYETISETDFSLDPRALGFRPQRIVDITDYCQRKLEIMRVFASELDVAPFPRCPETIEALARSRGSVAGCTYAESFMVLRQIV